MGKPTEHENNIKLKTINWAISKQLEKSTPINNECTEKKVLSRANKIVSRLGFKNISRSTLLQSKNPEWITVNKRIVKHKELYKKVKKAADKGLKNRIAELEELCRNQNTKLAEYLTKNQKLEKEKDVHEQAISDLVDQIRDLGGEA